MATHKLPVGSVRLVGGRRRDLTRTVQFEGEEMATRTANRGSEGTRGVTETLYYDATSSRLIVHVANWSKRPEEGAIYSLLEVTGDDLQKGARFEALGKGAWVWLRR
jgi:hypothetical protein